MKIKKVLKIMGIIIAILILFVLIHTVRNYIIITKLQDKIQPYSNSNNYYIKSVATEEDKTRITMEYYKKDNKQVVFLERNLNGEVSKISIYNNGQRTDTFTDGKDVKVAQLNSGTVISINIYNHLETDNNWQTFLGSIFARIKSINLNGKECYRIKGFLSSTSLTDEGGVYIEKDTGLFIKTVEERATTEREYKFDSVEDTIFTEPDISQYTLRENN